MSTGPSSHDKRYSSLTQAGFATVRSIVGPALLYLPRGVADAGYFGAAGIFALTYGLFILGVTRLLQSWETHALRASVQERVDLSKMNQRHSRRSGSSSSHGEPLVVKAVQGGDADSYSALAGSLLGPWGRACVQTCVMGLQLGCGVSFFIFIAETVQAIVSQFGDGEVPTWLMMTSMAVFETPFATVKSVAALQRPNGVGNACVLLALVLVVLAACTQLSENGPADGLRAVVPEKAYLFLGTCVFAFEGAASVTLPIASSLAPSDRPLFLKMYLAVVAGIACSYFAYATLAYFAWGPDVEVIVILSLGDSVFPSAVVRILYSFVVLASFPLQMFPVHDELDRICSRSSSTEDAWSPAPATEEEDAASSGPSNPHVTSLRDHRYDGSASATSSSRYPSSGGEKRGSQFAALAAPGPIAGGGGGESDRSPMIGGGDGYGLSGQDQHAEDVATMEACAPLPASPLETKRDPWMTVRRIATVFAAMLLGLWGKDALDHIVALMGALASAPLALVIPPLMHTALMDLEAADYDRRASALAARRDLHNASSNSGSVGSRGHNRDRRGVAVIPLGTNEATSEVRLSTDDADLRILAPRTGGEGGLSAPLPPPEVSTVRNPLTVDVERARMLVLRASHERAGNSGTSGIHGDSDAENSDEEGIAEGYTQHQVLRSREEQASERRLNILVLACGLALTAGTTAMVLASWSDAASR